MKKVKITKSKTFRIILGVTIIISLILSMFPVQSIIVEPGFEYNIGNETYKVNQAMSFSRVIYTDTYIIFNNTGWNISAPSNILITLRHINESTVDAVENDELLEFEVYMISGSTTISISGFRQNIIHTIYKDGSPDSTFLSNSTGCIEITIASGVSYIYTVYLGANTAPTISNPDPADTATGISLSPTLSADIADPNGNLMDWYIRTNDSGSWVTLASNNNAGNSTISTATAGRFINYSTLCYWSVNVTDGTNWTNATYSFTTLANTAPSISSPSPGDGASGVSVSLSSLSVTIEDNEDTFNWTITTNPNMGSDSANDASNGSKTCSVSGLSYDAYYTWTVRVTDATSWTNTTYDFTVESDPGGGPPPNSAPTVSNPYPADEATLVSFAPICHVLVADANLDSIDVNFYWYNDTSEWGKMQTNSSVSSGNTIYWTFNNASEYNTVYYWNVTVDDGTDNITYSYSFTTIIDNPVISSNSPTNNSINIIRNTSVSVTVFDYQGDSMNITWRSNSSGSWVDFGWNVSVGNGTYSQTFSNSTNHNTKYWWSVNISSWTNATYSFTTKSPVAPVISSPLPRDGRQYVSIYTANVSIVISDTNSDFNYTIETDPDVGSISENNVNDGVKTCVISGLAYSTTYTWYVNATDGATWVRASYTFTTKGDTDFDIEDFKLNLPEWAMGPYKVYVGDFVWMFLFVGVIAIAWGSSKHVSTVFIVILLTFAAYGTQRVFVDNSEISLLFSIIAAVCISAIMLGLFLKKKYG